MNVINYVLKYQDFSFKEKPFNEIDALIFTLLSYIDFSILQGHDATVKDTVEKMGKLIRLKEKFLFNNKNKNLLEILATTKRYKNIIVSNYVKVMSNTCQFGAVTFKVPHEFKFIAFAGTGDELVGWKEDFKLSYLYPVEAQIYAKEYLNKNVKLNDLLIYTGGHSKGGNLAVAALMEANIFTRHRVKYAFNFDGPGFLKEEITSKKYKKINKKIRTYNPIESVVGVLLEMDSFKKTISSKNHGVNQHDAYFWEINDNKFKEGKLTKFALDIHKKSIDITKKYSKEQLELFVNTVFNLLDKSGYTLKSELDKVDIKKLIKATHELNHLDKEKKEIIIAILKLIVFGVKEEN